MGDDTNGASFSCSSTDNTSGTHCSRPGSKSNGCSTHSKRGSDCCSDTRLHRRSIRSGRAWSGSDLNDSTTTLPGSSSSSYSCSDSAGQERTCSSWSGTDCWRRVSNSCRTVTGNAPHSKSRSGLTSHYQSALSEGGTNLSNSAAALARRNYRSCGARAGGGSNNSGLSLSTDS